jgi:hypothetical protein
MNFKNYLANNTEQRVAALIYLSVSQNMNESIDIELMDEGIKDFLKKINLGVIKGPSLIDYTLRFTSGIGMMVLAALQGDKEKVKAISTTFSKSELIDFLSTLDDITLGVISAPLKLIQAVTGWDLLGSLKKITKSTQETLKEIQGALNIIKSGVGKIMDNKKSTKVLKSISNIENNLPGPIAFTLDPKAL